MSVSRKFIHDDVVKVTETGEAGLIKGFHQDEDRIIYTVRLQRDPAIEVAVPEEALELVKIANDDETGLSMRYVT